MQLSKKLLVVPFILCLILCLLIPCLAPKRSANAFSYNDLLPIESAITPNTTGSITYIGYNSYSVAGSFGRFPDQGTRVGNINVISGVDMSIYLYADYSFWANYVSAYLYDSVSNTSIIIPTVAGQTYMKYLLLDPTSDVSYSLVLTYPNSNTQHNFSFVALAVAGSFNESDVINSIGYSLGYSKAYTELYEPTYNLGYNDGYSDGYNLGTTDVSNNKGIFTACTLRYFGLNDITQPFYLVDPSVSPILPDTYVTPYYFGLYFNQIIYNMQDENHNDLGLGSYTYKVLCYDFDTGIYINEYYSIWNGVQYYYSMGTMQSSGIHNIFGNDYAYFYFSDGSVYIYDNTDLANPQYIDLYSYRGKTLLRVYVLENNAYEAWNGFNFNNQTTISYQNGYGVGKRDGYKNGYYDGVENGYIAGYAQARNEVLGENDFTFLALFSAIVDAPISTIKGILNFDLLGVNLSSLFFGLITCAIIIFVVRLFFSGK